MKATIHADAEQELEVAFDHYQAARTGLGLEFLTEFRRGVDLILEHPEAWNPLEKTYRRFRLHRFPYGIVYRIDRQVETIVILAVMHLHRGPGYWRGRDRG